MDLKESFEKIMADGTDMALATSVENVPNVRILNYIYFKNEKVMYFQSQKGAPKEKEFEKNENVAFTTIPQNGVSYVRVNNATVKKSEKTIFDLQDIFIEKMPFYKEIIEHTGNLMDLYEIHFSTIQVYPDPDRFEELKL
jgi:uncharacterized pyridoxamine 5'-phosphate oxidase family protein